MKNHKNTLLKFFVTLFILTVLSVNFSMAQTPPPPNGNGGNPTQGGHTPVGGSAPIAGGLSIILALGLAYGGKKVLKLNHQVSIKNRR